MTETFPRSYDSEGRLTNVTFPTGMVTSLHNDMSSGAVAVDIETSGRDEDVSITTNLSSVDSFYMLVQGTVSQVHLELEGFDFSQSDGGLP